MVDHCIAFFRKRNERRLYESYIADALKAIAENTAKAISGGIGMSKRYADLLQEMQGDVPQEEETRTAADVIGHIKDKINRLGG